MQRIGLRGRARGVRPALGAGQLLAQVVAQTLNTQPGRAGTYTNGNYLVVEPFEGVFSIIRIEIREDVPKYLRNPPRTAAERAAVVTPCR